MENKKEVVLSLKNIDITFGRGRNLFKAVSNVSFDIFKGETVSLVGESGSGKTTIGRAVVRVNPLSAGYIMFKGDVINGQLPVQEFNEYSERIQHSIDEANNTYPQRIKDLEEKNAQKIQELQNELNEKLASAEDKAALNAEYQEKIKALKKEVKDLKKEFKDTVLELKDSLSCTKGKIPYRKKREFTRKIQMIFQDPSASLNERATIDYIVSEGLNAFHLYKDEKERVEKVEKIIQEVGLLPEHLTRYPHEFSGGQRQRVGLARSIVMDPEFVVADEPISALDVSIRAQVLNLLKKFQKERGITYLFIAHDLSIVRFISDRIVVIHKGKIVEIAETEELFNHPLHPYTKSLMSAIPIPDPILEKGKQLIEYKAEDHQYKDGDDPELVDIGYGHFVYGSANEIEEYRKVREGAVDNDDPEGIK